MLIMTPTPEVKAMLEKTINLVKRAPAEQCAMQRFFARTDHSTWGSSRGWTDAAALAKGVDFNCKTAACVAGWIIAANRTAAVDFIKNNPKRLDAGNEIHFGVLAAYLLNLQGTSIPDHVFCMEPIISTELSSELDGLGITIDGNPKYLTQLEVFDRLDPNLRKACLVLILERMRDGGRLDWFDVITVAVTTQRLADQPRVETPGV